MTNVVKLAPHDARWVAVGRWDVVQRLRAAAVAERDAYVAEHLRELAEGFATQGTERARAADPAIEWMCRRAWADALRGVALSVIGDEPRLARALTGVALAVEVGGELE